MIGTAVCAERERERQREREREREREKEKEYGGAREMHTFVHTFMDGVLVVDWKCPKNSSARFEISFQNECFDALCIDPS